MYLKIILFIKYFHFFIAIHFYYINSYKTLESRQINRSDGTIFKKNLNQNMLWFLQWTHF